MIPFAYQVTAQEKDPHIGDKLLKELEGILAWCVEGCMKWQKEGLNPPDNVLNAIATYRDDLRHSGAVYRDLL